MLKKVETTQLKLGMYIHELDCDWMSHPFLRNRFALADDKQLHKIVEAGIRYAYIDTDKGLDADAPTEQEAAQQIEEALQAFATTPKSPIKKVSSHEELARAKQIKGQAQQLVHNVMQDVRLGRAVELEQVDHVVENITESILRNSGALLGLLTIKNKDDYTFLHSVSVCTLLVAFSSSIGLDAELTRKIGIGGLLHDTGKSLVPDEVLNKPGKLTDEEFEIIKRHPRDGYEILLKTPNVDAVALDITLHHHERMNGRGYPDKLPADQISQAARMAAIVDVYDAITADRCYHQAMSAPQGLRKLHEWSGDHFDPELVQAFIKCVGIYPTGTLVRLESGRLGIVLEQNESNLLTPKLKVIFSTKSNSHVKPYEVDLSKSMGSGGADRIVTYEDPSKWGIDMQRMLEI